MTPQETIEAAKLMTEWAQSVIDGKPIEIESLTNQGWKEVSPEWNWQLAHYRRKPQPKRVPLETEDVPPGSVYRHETWSKGTWEAICGIDSVTFRTFGRSITFKFAASDPYSKISRDNGKTWEPCSKEVME